jgi:hypothetical protein
MGPDIGTVEIHKDRDIAHNANRTLRAIGSKRLPLFEEKELHGTADIEIVLHFRVRLLDRHWIAMSQFARPAVPAFQFETRAQAIEENEVIEPPLILPAEAFVTRERRSAQPSAKNCAPLQTAAAASGGKPTGNPPARRHG